MRENFSLFDSIFQKYLDYRLLIKTKNMFNKQAKLTKFLGKTYPGILTEKHKLIKFLRKLSLYVIVCISLVAHSKSQFF